MKISKFIAWIFIIGFFVDAIVGFISYCYNIQYVPTIIDLILVQTRLCVVFWELWLISYWLKFTGVIKRQ